MAAPDLARRRGPGRLVRAVCGQPLMRAPGFGPLGFGIAMLAVGGVLVSQGHDLTGLGLDLFGVLCIWGAFRTDHDEP